MFGSWLLFYTGGRKLTLAAWGVKVNSSSQMATGTPVTITARMDHFGRYRVKDEIGRGAMGIVYRAEDPAIGRTVAIKTIRLSELSDMAERAKLRDRLFREAQSAGMLSHPGIVTVYDVAEEGDYAYIAMEFVDGPTLDRMVETDPPDAKLVLSILNQTAAALDYAHKRGIVHRDIKPANIMVHERTTAKITDFGVARIVSHQMTQAGGLVGTPNYMSPEQIQEQRVSGSSDQFSLAVIAYELLTGERPFVAESISALVFKIVKEEPDAVHRLNQTLGWAVDTVIKRALSKDPEGRFPTCSDFTFALENACRTSKGWKPIARAQLEAMPTVVPASKPLRFERPAPPTGPLIPDPYDPDTVPIFVQRKSVAPVVVPPVADPIPSPAIEPPPPAEETPRFLRIARRLAMIVFAIGLATALVVGGLQFFAEQEETPVTAVDETARPSAEGPKERQTFSSSKPSPVPLDEHSAVLPADPPPAGESEKPASFGPTPIRLVTNPPGASLVLDGSSSGVTCTSPCTVPLSPGRHTLAAMKEGFRRTLRIFETPRDTEIFLNLDPTTGTVLVNSEPAGASISVDGQARSEKTPAVLTLRTGSHSIEVARNGENETREIIVRDSTTTSLSVKFE